jgi:hypothetical protein
MENEQQSQYNQTPPVILKGMSTGAAVVLGISGIIIAIIAGAIIFASGTKTIKDIDFESFDGLEIQVNENGEQSVDNVSVIEPETTSQSQGEVCDFDYSATEESQVVSEETPSLIAGYETKCDGRLYITLDYLSPGDDNPDTEVGFYGNTNLRLRTFRVNENALMNYMDENPQGVQAYLAELKIQEGIIFGEQGTYLYHPQKGTSVFNVLVQNGEVAGIAGQYLP